MQNCGKSVWILLKSGADKNLANKEGKTPLDVAKDQQNFKMIKLLTEELADNYAEGSEVVANPKPKIT